LLLDDIKTRAKVEEILAPLAKGRRIARSMPILNSLRKGNNDGFISKEGNRVSS